MTANEFCNLQYCRNYGCSKLDRDKDLCRNVSPPRKPSTLRRGIDCNVQTPRWSIKDCRAKKCEYLKNTSGYGDAQERCHVFGKERTLMPGALSHCLQDLDNMSPEEFFRHIPLPGPRIHGERKTPGIKNCPNSCPYKIISDVDGSGKRKTRKGTCAFSGEVLGGNCGVCHTTILDAAPEDQQHQIAVITVAIERMRKYPPSAEQCSRTCCPDGVRRCKEGDTACPLIRIPFTDLPGCPLWRIPAKLLPAPVEQKEIPAPAPVARSQDAPAIKKKREKPAETQEPAEPEKAPAPEKKRKKKPVKLVLSKKIIASIVMTGHTRVLCLEPDVEPITDEELILLGLKKLRTWYRKLGKKHHKADLGGTCQSSLLNPEQVELQDDEIGPCRSCTRDCPDDNDGCEEYQEHIRKLCQESEDPPKEPQQSKPNCGGKRPALSRCPGNCPDRMIVPEDNGREKNYPQGRCRQTGEKLREMKACPNDPPKTTNPLYRFLNEHHDAILSGMDLPIVPPDLAGKAIQDKVIGGVPVKLFIYERLDDTMTNGAWHLSPSGKLRKVREATGALLCGLQTPECRFSFTWRYVGTQKKQSEKP